MSYNILSQNGNLFSRVDQILKRLTLYSWVETFIQKADSTNIYEYSSASYGFSEHDQNKQRKFPKK